MPKSTVRIRVVGVKKVRKYLQRFPIQRGSLAEKVFRDALIDIGDEITTKAATKYIIRSGPAGVIDSKRLTNRHGGAGLVGSISTDRGPLSELAIESGSDLVYARPHELGSPKQNLPARPFMLPALEDVFANDVERIMDGALQRLVK